MHEITTTAYGWRPDYPDQRDHSAPELLGALYGADRPKAYSMRPGMVPVQNQGQLGSCVSQAVRSALRYTGIEVGGDTDLPSSLYIYYNGRMIQGTVNEDSGLSIRTGFKAIAKYGYCDASLCPYVIDNFKNKPSDAAYKDGQAKKLGNAMYAAVPQNLDALRNTLAAGNPIVFGFSVYSSFDRIGKNGLVPVPRMDEKIRGGHAMLITGYNDATGLFEVMNSWGTGWGNKGYCYFRYEHLTNEKLAHDFWTVISVPQLRAAAAA